MYIVSACLLGANCKYNGENNDNEAVKDFCEGHKILAVCPETAGGLKAPRPPAEQIDGKVVNREGEDVTEYFQRGAEICLEKVRAMCQLPDECSGSDDKEIAELAILKANSPSCGCGRIYDGTFTGTLTGGDGIFARLLKDHGIKVITEMDI